MVLGHKPQNHFNCWSYKLVGNSGVWKNKLQTVSVLLWAVDLRGSGLKQDWGGTAIAGSAPLQASSLHPQLLPDLLHLGLELPLLCLQTLLLCLAEAPVPAPVKPRHVRDTERSCWGWGGRDDWAACTLNNKGILPLNSTSKKKKQKQVYLKRIFCPEQPTYSSFIEK